jgi:hypothetical protein
MSIPLNEFVRREVPCTRVFITENKVNGVCFPDCSHSLVIFGLRFGISSLREAEGLQQKEV